MEFQKDFEDLCASLNGRNVDYLIVEAQRASQPRCNRFKL
jgi:hypothetical protein